MNIYLVPIKEGNDCYIKKIHAQSLKHAEEKIHHHFYDKYDWVEGDLLSEIIPQLKEEGVYIGMIYGIEDFT